VLRVGPRPDQLVERARRSWTGSGWGVVGRARSIALGYDAVGDATGLYDYALEVSALYTDGSTASWVMRGQQAVVNRRHTSFGSGWWLAGLEQIVRTGNGSWLWVGGDGSTRVYEPLADRANLWVARTPDRGQDTLWGMANYPGEAYRRNVPGGATVHFDPQGRHIATVNRLDHHTHFEYFGARLGRVYMPTAAGYSAFKPAYLFEYDGTAGGLRRVNAPDVNGTLSRAVQVQPHAASPAYVGAIVDPDGTRVTFGYDQAGHIASRWDRRDALVSYEFGPEGKLREALHHMGGYQAYLYNGQKEVRSRFTPAEVQGLGAVPADPAQVHTLLDGPRTDVNDHTRFWLDRFGAPWKIRNALEQETTVTRGDLRFPALATETNTPGADGTRVVTRAWYNARGLPDSTTVFNPLGDGRNATTRQAYGDSRWPDFVTRTVSPMGEVATRGYDAVGNLAWQLVGPDTLQQVRYGYYALNHATSPGLVQSVTLPVVGGQSATESFTYDSRGNLYTSSSPLGFTTTYARDVLGRETEVRSPIDASRTQVQRTFYNLSGAVDSTTTVGPPMNGADSLKVVVHNTYDREGRTLRVSRRSVPDP
ncbi:MAG TPA: RHS repeat domain-containing protein, partial [Longimicrobium sp.]|nr:RHS repeat domain-containing protein [Longimicrobium sp.]